MKTDRELLELAAKAIGNGAVWYSGFGMGVERQTHGFPELWDPLTDDGDALRLAVKLTLEIDVCMTGIAVRTPIGINVLIDSNEEPDAYAATRRAIVHAAALIGEAM